MLLSALSRPSLASQVYARGYAALNYRLRSLAAGRLRSLCRPTSILILLTERCNARCVHCDIWKNRGQEDAPSPEEWKRTLLDLRKWLGRVHIVFTGGEALLRPFTPDLVECASSAGLLAEILTHGYWPDQSRIERLAAARPWRVTISLDGLGPTHNRIRGREQFFANTAKTIATLQRIRTAEKLKYAIRLKCVIMRHNLDEVAEIARYAQVHGLEVFYQPIEQNYNTPEDPEWYLHGENWPNDANAAVAAVRQLIALKRQGLPIVNGYSQLEAMVPYFQDPDAWRVATQSHSAHERETYCSALSLLQVQANGDVKTCLSQPAAGNIRSTPIRTIWERRPRYWVQACCLSSRLSAAEKTIQHRD